MLNDKATPITKVICGVIQGQEGKASQAALSDRRRDQSIHKNSRVHVEDPAVFMEGRRSATLGESLRKRAVLDELTQKTLLTNKNRAAALHRFTNEADHLLSLGLH